MVSDDNFEKIIYKLQQLVKNYKKSDQKIEKLGCLWDIGDLLVKNNLAHQKKYWEIQNQYFVNRSILLRGQWINQAFKKEELSKISCNISMLFKILPRLADGSKYNIEDKREIKLGIFGEKKILIKTSLKNTRRNIIKSKEQEEKLKELIQKLEITEINKFESVFFKSEIEDIKKVVFSLLRQDVPTTADKDIINLAIKKFQKNDFIILKDIFILIYEIMMSTKSDSKKILKKTMTPEIMMPFLNKIFFKTKLQNA